METRIALPLAVLDNPQQNNEGAKPASNRQ
jgi:hypothetical protein